jgi:hypothetical protein
MMTIIRRDWGAMIAGAVLGFALVLFLVSVGPSLDDAAWRIYDQWRPVATINAEKLPSPSGEVHARLTVVRHRGECAYQQMVAIEEFPGGNAVRVFGTRVDNQPPANIPEGVKYVAEWRFWPVGVGKLRAAVEYLCDGRRVAVQIGGL